MNVIFVCTGNTCRSPMAEYLLRNHLQNIGRTDIRVSSGGLCAVGGAPASENSIEALREWEIDLTGFRSSPVSPEAIADADLILTMTNQHRQVLCDVLPQFAHKIQTLKQDGDILDPYMQSLAVYRATRDEIHHWILKRLEDGSID